MRILLAIVLVMTVAACNKQQNPRQIDYYSPPNNPKPATPSKPPRPTIPGSEQWNCGPIYQPICNLPF